MNPIIENIYNQSKLNYKKIILAEGDDNRIIETAKIIRVQRIAKVYRPSSQGIRKPINDLFLWM